MHERSCIPPPTELPEPHHTAAGESSPQLRGSPEAVISNGHSLGDAAAFSRIRATRPPSPRSSHVDRIAVGRERVRCRVERSLFHFHVSCSSRIKLEGWPYATGFNDRFAGSTAVLASKIKSRLIPFLIPIQQRERERWKCNGAREVGRAHQAQPVVPACQRPSEVTRRGPPGACAVKVS